jgi:hypothetical protein
MALAATDPGDHWRRATAALAQVHQRLLAHAESLREALEPPHYVWTVENNDINGYLMPVAGTALSETERAELRARVDDDLATLRRLTGTIEQLRALMTEQTRGV